MDAQFSESFPSSSSGEGAWYLLQCKARQEQRALWHLENQAFECFHARRAVERKNRSGRLVMRREPLFPNYLFIFLEPGCNWQALTATRGVSRVVGFAGYPLPVPRVVVAALQQRCSSGEEPAKALFHPGDRVRITEGAFRDTEAVVAARNGAERVSLLIELIQRQHRVEVPLGSVVAR